MSVDLIRQVEDRLTSVRRDRADRKASLDAVLAPATRGKRDLTPTESAKFDALVAQIRGLDTEANELELRRVELEEAQRREAASAETRRLAGMGGVQRAHVTDPAIYHQGNGGPSFFRDLVGARRGDYGAAERLHRNNQAAATEARALGNTGAAGGSGGEFAPPGWMLDQFAALARAGRVTADRFTRLPLPEGVSTVNVPRVTGGTTAAVQTTQNTAVSQTDMTTGSVSSGIVTIAGKQVVAQQLVDQSGVAFDQLVLADLAADYARALDQQVISGSGTSGQLLGLLNVSGINAVTYTQATPAVAGAGGFYATLNKAISAVATSRYLAPTAVVMHPRRWSWVAAAFDGNNRPLVSPSGNAFNQVADAADVAAQGPVGQAAGLAVYVDANIPTNTGAGTNQDPVFVLRAEDVLLYESDVVMASFDAPFADSLGILYRVHGYSALVAGRWPASIAVINGTGLVSPSY